MLRQGQYLEETMIELILFIKAKFKLCTIKIEIQTRFF